MGSIKNWKLPTMLESIKTEGD